MKQLFKFTSLATIIILITTLLIIILIKNFQDTPFNPKERESISFRIKHGESLSRIAHLLVQRKIISSEFKFKLIVKLSHKDKSIKAGEYELSPSMTPDAILNILTLGKVKLYRVTFPEGTTIKEMSEILEQNKICSKKNFIKKAYDKSLLKKSKLKATSFEGYLFPDTYMFQKNESPEKIIMTMYNKFQCVYSKKFDIRAKRTGFSKHKIITLASIIEKETGCANERPIISSVFHNRLKKGMRLETDASVIYGIKNFDGNIKKKDLEEFTPYNTYKIKGLPPGPIANPGIDSIKAALYPSKTNFLFFVSKKNGTHYFSRTLKEHNRAVRKYQLRR